MTIELPSVEECRIDPIAYTYRLSGGAMPAPKHHYSWYYYVCLDTEYDHVNIIGPRESAKSQFAENALSWVIGNYPWDTNMVICASKDLAEKRLDRVKSIIKNSAQFKEIFPWIQIDDHQPNRVDEFTVWSTRYIDQSGVVHEGLTYSDWRSIIDMMHERDPSLTAYGILGRMTGKRISRLILLDDIMDDMSSASESQRDKIFNRVQGTVSGFMKPTARMLNLCNRWHEEDVGGRFMKIKRANGSYVWKTFQLNAIDEKGRSYWPEYWPLERLQAKEEEIGAAMFRATYMNNPVGFGSGLFKEEHIKVPLPDPLPEFEEIYISTDLAYTDEGDFTVAVALGKFKPERGPFKICVLQMIRGKWNLVNSFKNIFLFADWVVEKYGRLDGILFEKQGIQGATVKEKFKTEVEQNGRAYPYRLVSIMGTKGDRAKFLSVKAQSGDLYFNQKIVYDHPAIISELLGIKESGKTAASHDDIVDALSLPGQMPSWASGGSVFESGVGYVKSDLLL